MYILDHRRIKWTPSSITPYALRNAKYFSLFLIRNEYNDNEAGAIVRMST